jgi:hypothetical protein
VYSTLAELPEQAVDNLETTGGVPFRAEARVTQDGRQFIGLPHGNRIYADDWGSTTNSFGKDGQRIGHYAQPLDEWCSERIELARRNWTSDNKQTTQIVESYKTVFAGTREAVLDLRVSARSRLVWFVGIAGYAFLNAKRWLPKIVSISPKSSSQ